MAVSKRDLWKYSCLLLFFDFRTRSLWLQVDWNLPPTVEPPYAKRILRFSALSVPFTRMHTHLPMTRILLIPVFSYRRKFHPLLPSPGHRRRPFFIFLLIRFSFVFIAFGFYFRLLHTLFGPPPPDVYPPPSTWKVLRCRTGGETYWKIGLPHNRVFASGANVWQTNAPGKFVRISRELSSNRLYVRPSPRKPLCIIVYLPVRSDEGETS